MNQALMPLQEWVSNNEYFNFLYQLAVPITQNVLGMSWNPYTDNMNIVVDRNKPKSPSKITRQNHSFRARNKC